MKLLLHEAESIHSNYSSRPKNPFDVPVRTSTRDRIPTQFLEEPVHNLRSRAGTAHGDNKSLSLGGALARSNILPSIIIIPA